jgi:aminodeoxyfutalosine synthase
MISSRTFTFRDASLQPIWEKVRSGERLTKEDGLALYASNDLIGIGRMANEVARAKSGDSVYFVLNRKLEPTNICVLSCKFCDFAVKAGSAEAYEMTLEDMLSKLRPDLHEVHITAGLHPKWPWEFYTNMVREIKTQFPNVDVKAFTAVEIDYFAKKFKKTHEQVLTELQEAGLRTMPGGGAEVFSERVRKELFKQKIGAKTWFEIHKKAHKLGIQSNVTMLYGHIETLEERIDHMLQVRECQDETNGFLAFIPLAFQPGNTGIKVRNDFTSAIDDLKTIAISRLMLDNMPHIKAYWVMLTAEVAAIALNFGADDMDGTVGEERIAHDAGAISPMKLAKDKLISIIHEAGKLPVERDVWYNPIEVYPAKGKTVVSKMPYLNSAPFYHDFKVENVLLAPLRPKILGELALRDNISGGPMSLHDYFQNRERFEMLPFGVASNGAVRSVTLYSNYEWKELDGKRIGITGDTATSIQLLRILLTQKYGVNAHFERIAPAATTLESKYDAVLFIGDQALRTDKIGISMKHRFDLAEEWTSWKNLPFVFAVWAVAKTLDTNMKDAIRSELERNIAEYERAIPEEALIHGHRIGMSDAEVIEYLHGITYRLGKAEEEAIDKFEKDVVASIEVTNQSFARM